MKRGSEETGQRVHKGVTSKTAKLLGAAVIALTACSRADVKVSGPLPQRGYVWQREWTPAVIAALAEAKQRMDGLVLLSAEISFGAMKPKIARASIDWRAVKRQTRHCSVALRVAPFAGPLREDDAEARALVDLAKQILEEAHAQNVKIEEFQLDFDCAQNNL